MAILFDVRFGNRVRTGRARRTVLAVAFGVGLAGLSVPAWGQSVWNGNTSSDWFDASNWVASILPGSGSLTTLNTTTPNGAVVGDNLVNGAGATGILRVGNNGTGTLAIENGGRVDSVAARIGVLAGSTGTVKVSGVNAAGDRSRWISIGAIDVGDGGTGALFIEDGGRVESVLSSVIGRTGTGTAFVSGSNGIRRSAWLSAGGITVGESGTGTLTLAEQGLVNIGLGSGTATLAKNAGSTGTLNIGAASGQAPVAPGRLSAANLNFGAGTGLLTFNHTDTTRLYRFEPMISGAGTIGIHSGYTNFSGDSSGFTGTTTIDGGTLAVNGALGGTVNVLSGGTIGGTGSLNGPVTLAGGSTIAPGKSIGTLTVNSVTFQPGSAYVAEVDRLGRSDRIRATGTATINGGSLHVDGNFFGGASYRILDADGGVTGRFDGIATLTGRFNEIPTPFSIFLDPTLTYGANSIDLVIARSDVAFRSVAKTRNQTAVADGTDTLAFGNEVYDALTNLNASEAPGAFDALSGEIHPSGKGAIIEGNELIVGAVKNRIRKAFDIAPASATVSFAGTVPSHSYAGTSPAPPTDASGADAAISSLDAQDGSGPQGGAWITGYGSVLRDKSRTNTSARGSKNYGFLVGLDAPVADDWLVGVMGGAGRTDYSVDRLLSSGSSDNYYAGVYGGGRWNQAGLSIGALYGWHEINTRRSVEFPGISQRVKAGYDARSLQLFGDLGYTMQMQETSVEPFAALSYIDLRTRAFTESGGSAALSARSESTGIAFSTLGVRLAKDTVIKGELPVTFDGMLGWRHAYGDVDPVSRFALAGSSQFTVEGVPIGRDAVVMEFGAKSELTEAVSFSTSFQGQFSEKATVYGVQAGLSIKTDAQPVADVSPKSEDDWRFVIAAPSWLPWTKGAFTVGPSKSDVYLPVWSAVENLRWYLPGEIGVIFQEEITGTIETFYVDLGSSQHTLRGALTSIGFQEAITEGRLGYRPVSTQRGWLEAYAGARFWSIMANLSVTTPGLLLPARTVAGSTGERWLDPIVGLRGEYDFGNRWYLSAQGDVGGFGLGSDFSWRAQGGAGFRFTDNLALEVQYKAIGVDYDNGKSGLKRFGVDMVQQGPQIRVALTF